VWALAFVNISISLRSFAGACHQLPRLAIMMPGGALFRAMTRRYALRDGGSIELLPDAKAMWA
jgi:hypothetical protein